MWRWSAHFKSWKRHLNNPLFNWNFMTNEWRNDIICSCFDHLRSVCNLVASIIPIWKARRFCIFYWYNCSCFQHFVQICYLEFCSFSGVDEKTMNKLEFEYRRNLVQCPSNEEKYPIETEMQIFDSKMFFFSRPFDFQCVSSLAHIEIFIHLLKAAKQLFWMWYWLKADPLLLLGK